MDNKFIQEAEKEGLIELKGHPATSKKKLKLKFQIKNFFLKFLN